MEYEILAKEKKTPAHGSKTAKVLQILSDGKPHSTFELVRRAYNQHYASVARIGALIFDLKRRYGKNIFGAHSKKNPAKYWYIMGPDNGGPGIANILIDNADNAAGKWQ